MSMLDQADADGVILVSDDPRMPREAMEESPVWGLDTGPETLTQQSFIEECDINTIVRKYMDVGAPVDWREPLYGDFSEIPDYQTAFEVVQAAADSFAALPSTIRTRFGNDPAQMMAFLADDANREESYTLGLRERPKPSDTDRLVSAIGELKPEAPPAK